MAACRCAGVAAAVPITPSPRDGRNTRNRRQPSLPFVSERGGGSRNTCPFMFMPLQAGENVVALDDCVPKVETSDGGRALFFRDFEPTTAP